MHRIKVNLFLLLQILSCFATLLRKQDASVWTYPSTIQAYHGLLSFAVHSKPKVCLLRPSTLNVRSNNQLTTELKMRVWISMFFRSVKQRSKVCVPFSEGVTSCLQITPQLITLLQCLQLSSASKRWSVQEVRRSACACLLIPLFSCTA